jgi:hypothetical protein
MLRTGSTRKAEARAAASKDLPAAIHCCRSKTAFQSNPLTRIAFQICAEAAAALRLERRMVIRVDRARSADRAGRRGRSAELRRVGLRLPGRGPMHLKVGSVRARRSAARYSASASTALFIDQASSAERTWASTSLGRQPGLPAAATRSRRCPPDSNDPSQLRARRGRAAARRLTAWACRGFAVSVTGAAVGIAARPACTADATQRGGRKYDPNSKIRVIGNSLASDARPLAPRPLAVGWHGDNRRHRRARSFERLDRSGRPGSSIA